LSKVLSIRGKAYPKEIRERILQLAGEFKPPTKILQELRKEFPTYFKSKTARYSKKIAEFIANNRDEVNILREEYCRSIMEVPIANKRVRLERLEELYWEAMKRGRIDEAQKVLGKAREEIEGVKVNLSMYQMNFFGRFSDEELERREREIIERIRSLAGGEGEAAKEEGTFILSSAREAEVIPSISCED